MALTLSRKHISSLCSGPLHTSKLFTPPHLHTGVNPLFECIFVCLTSILSLLLCVHLLSLVFVLLNSKSSVFLVLIKLYFVKYSVNLFTSIRSFVQEDSLTTILFSSLASLFCLVLHSMSFHGLPFCSRVAFT